MKAFTVVKNWWNSASLPTRVIASAVATLLIVGAIALVASGVSSQSDTHVAAPLETTTPTVTPRATPSATALPSSSSTPSPEESQRQQEPAAIAAPSGPTAPVFETFGASATDYGIGVMMDNGPSTFPTGRIYATHALPGAQGTGPLTYSVSGLPVGAGFDADQRKVFIDTDVFIPANQENYTFNLCYIKQRVNLATTVQYTVSGPGGQATASVPLQFGLVALGAGILHQGC